MVGRQRTRKLLGIPCILYELIIRVRGIWEVYKKIWYDKSGPIGREKLGRKECSKYGGKEMERTAKKGKEEREKERGCYDWWNEWVKIVLLWVADERRGGGGVGEGEGGDMLMLPKVLSQTI